MQNNTRLNNNTCGFALNSSNNICKNILGLHLQLTITVIGVRAAFKNTLGLQVSKFGFKHTYLFNASSNPLLNPFGRKSPLWTGRKSLHLQNPCKTLVKLAGNPRRVMAETPCRRWKVVCRRWPNTKFACRRWLKIAHPLIEVAQSVWVV